MMRGSRTPLWARVITAPCYAISKAIDAWKDWRTKFQDQRSLDHDRLPQNRNASASRMTAGSYRQQSSPFLRLPTELRLRIYELALQSDTRVSRAGRCIMQPAVGLKQTFLALHAQYPASWLPQQHIRSDTDPPSCELPRLLALGASATRPKVHPPSQGCVRYGPRDVLACGDIVVNTRWFMEEDAKQHCNIAALLRVCRTMYRDVLPLLYSENTFSLFGAKMVAYFARNISPDGLGYIRNVHLILRLDAARWSEPKRKEEVLAAMRCLARKYPSLAQLDVEVMIVWGRPDGAPALWTWLTREVFPQLTGLDEFVLKVSVLQPLPKPKHHRTHDDWDPDCEALESWDDDDYKNLKLAVTKGNN